MRPAAHPLTHQPLWPPLTPPPQRERKKRWTEKQRGAVADAVAAAAAFAKKHPVGGPALGEDARRQREEVEGRVKLLAELDEKYEDTGACSLF